ncbi:MAG: UDP-N-acetylmuramoyl-tripeptide--D-alanyl-D-alanine ligase [Gammaproteobacteria bacterium]|nr:UDP-N-acetylmuramoyl-tripeptide--D-alanyl-D-alanine ligase [Gammaproteobacteria bacterium]
MMALSQATKILNGTLTGKDVEFSYVSTDTRNIKKGDLYIALKGDTFDGHDYIGQAEQAGAIAAIVHEELVTNLPVIKVEDTRKALGGLAAAWRQSFSGKVVAITGSNGKTTVKEMVSAIAAKQGEVLATRGNFNNDIGLPLTLLRMEQEDFAVIEMGANHPGEISNLTRITKPDVALINNAGPAHLEGFGSLKGVAQEKGEIYQGLSTNGVVVLNRDDEFSDYWAELADGKRIISFSMKDKSANITGVWQQSDTGGVLNVTTDNENIIIKLKVYGLHNAMNALAAIAVANALDINSEYIVQALEEFVAVKGRLEFHKVGKSITLIDDTYNANPGSLAAGIEVLVELPGQHWLVLGDMGELGDEEQRVHFDAGMKARTAGVSRLLTIGEVSRYAVDAFGENAQNFKTKEELVSYIKEHQTEDLGILVKGSRFMHMEQIVESIIKGSN